MSFNIQTITDFRKLLHSELTGLYQEKEIDSVAGIIIKTHFKVNRLHQFPESGFKITDKSKARLLEIIAELKSGKPIQYVSGVTEFYGLPIKVNPNVLIPRQETEELVDLVIKENKDYRGRIIDFGTGSGCIAIAIGKNLPGAVVTATDISSNALKVASENAVLNGVSIDFILSDLLENDPMIPSPAGVIVSNPPYVRESEKNRMHINVKGFEPHIALFVPDNDPLMFYRCLFGISRQTLEPGGKIYFEINEALGDELIDMTLKYGFREAEILKDLNGKDRILKGKFYE